MLKKILASILCIAALTSFSACSESGSGGKSTPAPTPGKLKVYVSLNALKEFARAVGGDKVDVTAMIPDGAKPHAFEPKAQDVAGLSKADVLIINGLGMEPWAEKTISAAGNKNLITVEASKGVAAIKIEDEEEIKEHGQYDPHTWLSLKCAQTEVRNIRDAFSRADPSNRDYYEKNCESYVSQLESLYNEFSAKFSTAASKNFVTGHAAFAYLCRDFGLSQNSVEDVFSEGEPSPQKLALLVEYCRKNKVTTIFAEEMASPEVSKALAREVGAKVETIYTLAGSEDGKSYLERMRINLSRIYESLASTRQA